MFRAILVPLDGSSFAEHALPMAVALARRCDATLDLALVHVAQPLGNVEATSREAMEEWEYEHRQKEADYLHALAERIAAQEKLTVRPVLRTGPIVPTLHRVIRDRGIDLVVLTTHGRGGIERAWLGSVADLLIRHVAVPVLAVRPSDEEEALRTAAEPVRSVLVPLDGSDEAATALDSACRLLGSAASTLHLLRVVAPPAAVGSPYLPHAAQLTRDELRRRESSANDYLDATAARLRTPELTVHTAVVHGFHPARAILQHAEDHDIDAIVMATHGRNPLARAVLGSVTDKVVRGARHPVLVTRIA